MGSSYRYKRLNLATDAIRLIRILKGDTGPIECEMLETYLNQVEEHPYEALSYVWGNSEPKHKIWVDGCPFKVAENLFEALLNLRQPGEDRTFWIDAICINQHHHAERGHQVGQMRRIYGNARTVVIWLGASTQEIDRLFHWMRCLNHRILTAEHQPWQYRDWQDEPWEQTPCEHEPWEHQSWKHQPEEHYMYEWERQWDFLRSQFGGELQRDVIREGLRELLEREWFSRVWVIQEAALAKTAVITCGSNTVSSRAFVVMPKLLWVSCNENVQSRLEIMPGLLREESWWWSRRRSQDLGTLLEKFGKSKASDPRDIIYALLGLSEDAFVSRALRPDYEITLQEAIQHTVAYLLKHWGESSKYLDHQDMPTWSMAEFLHALKDLVSRVYAWTQRHREAFLPDLYSSLTGVKERDHLKCSNAGF